MITLEDLNLLDEKELDQLEQNLDSLLSVWDIQNLRATSWRFHDDQHIGNSRRELHAIKHPSIDYKSLVDARLKILVDCLEGNTLIHPATTPIIEVNKSNDQARAVFLSFGFEALSIHREEPMAIWSIGYNPENYIKQDGEWRILCGGWQRVVKAQMEKGWVHNMQKTNARPPLTDEQDQQLLGKYAYRKDKCRLPVPEPPRDNTFDEYPGDANLDWRLYNLE